MENLSGNKPTTAGKLLRIQSEPASIWIVAAWSVVAIAPVFAYYAAHFLQEGVQTGFILADLPYYSANGREVFERGNGVFYSNPYDTSVDAPVIYFQWLIWLIGFGIVYLGFDPGIQFVTIGLIAAVVCAFLTFRLVEAVLPNRRHIGLLYLFTMWGGGGFILFGLAANLGLGAPPFHSLTRFMPFGGWWFLNWGLNSLFATEAVYHAFVAAMWLCMLKEKEWMAVATVGFLAATHPFSGLQHLFGMSVWFGLRFILKPTWQTFAPLFTLGSISGLFLFYYTMYLPSFDSHSSLQADWELGWNLTTRTMVLAYGPVSFAMAYRLFQDRNWAKPEISFFMVSFLCSLFLAKHELWTDSHQPIHFTHGYLWMPLWLTALPAIQSELVRVSTQRSRFRHHLVITMLSCVILLDNIGWMVIRWPRHTGSSNASLLENNEPFALYRSLILTPHSVSLDDSLSNMTFLPSGTITFDQWDIIQIMRSSSPQDYVLCTDAELSYLLPTYTPTRVYIGHWYNTPDLKDRLGNFKQWFETGSHDGWLDDITRIILDQEHRSIRLSSEWKEIYRNPTFTVFARSE